MLTRLRGDSTRGSMVKTPSAMTTMSSGSTKASAQPNRPRVLGGPRRATMSGSDNGRPALGQLVDGHRQHDDHAEEDRRSEEHTSELQSHVNLVCRLLLEKKKNKNKKKKLYIVRYNLP